jgi:hypothetical protein
LNTRQGFPEIWYLSMWGNLKFTYEMPKNHTALNQTALNQTMWSQTKACITKSSCVNSRENREWLKLNGTIFFSGLVHSLIFWKSTMFWKPALFLFLGKEAPNLVDPLHWDIISHSAPQKQ